MPRLMVTLSGRGDDMDVTFVVDTGFNGDLALPLQAIQRLQAQPFDQQTHLMADGTLVKTAVYRLELDWLEEAWFEEAWFVEVLALEGNPLLGTGLLVGCHIDIEASEGGEVLIEPL